MKSMLKEPVILFDSDGNEYFSISPGNDSLWLYAKWSGEIKKEKLEKGAYAILDAIKQTECPLLLNDNRELKGNWLNSNDWLESDLNPRLYNAGLRYIAHIISPKFITKFSAVDLVNRPLATTLKIFEDPRDAKAWLKKMAGGIR